MLNLHYIEHAKILTEICHAFTNECIGNIDVAIELLVSCQPFWSCLQPISL